MTSDEQAAKVGDAFEFFAGGEFTAGIDLVVFRVVRTPAAEGIEVLQREAERVDLAMTGGASFVRAMHGELFADRLGSAGIGFDEGNVRRWRWRRVAEKFLLNINATQDGRGVDSVGGGGQKRGLS